SLLATMYTGNLRPQTAEKLAAIGDIVRQEQYMDFMYNRRFRSTLLCRAAVKLDRRLDSARFEQFYWRSLLVSETPVEDDVAAHGAADGAAALNRPLSFTVPGSTMRLHTQSPASRAAYRVLHRYRGLPVKPDDVVREAAERYGMPDNEE